MQSKSQLASKEQVPKKSKQNCIYLNITKPGACYDLDLQSSSLCSPCTD